MKQPKLSLSFLNFFKKSTVNANERKDDQRTPPSKNRRILKLLSKPLTFHRKSSNNNNNKNQEQIQNSNQVPTSQVNNLKRIVNQFQNQKHKDSSSTQGQIFYIQTLTTISTYNPTLAAAITKYLNEEAAFYSKFILDRFERPVGTQLNQMTFTPTRKSLIRIDSNLNQINLSSPIQKGFVNEQPNSSQIINDDGSKYIISEPININSISIDYDNSISSTPSPPKKNQQTSSINSLQSDLTTKGNENDDLPKSEQDQTNDQELNVNQDDIISMIITHHHHHHHHHPQSIISLDTQLSSDPEFQNPLSWTSSHVLEGLWRILEDK
ncbi:hypothetical protein CROQUDRAFT_108976 [Cronartium quercuum f. sp. fusiforme G11]|uniref:Uncharacterized protein n=1 Tax=Cronartium quercuum f. sp. fusiforme G11 TaxID=708437 RepID=A0A9P6NBT5_9BASI|nr:hypothetical protein CROQUDRAFT_108976 [Cronartium quercuum f. sp. fusiforme G11]